MVWRAGLKASKRRVFCETVRNNQQVRRARPIFVLIFYNNKLLLKQYKFRRISGGGLFKFIPVLVYFQTGEELLLYISIR